MNCDTKIIANIYFASCLSARFFYNKNVKNINFDFKLCNFNIRIMYFCLHHTDEQNKIKIL